MFPIRGRGLGPGISAKGFADSHSSWTDCAATAVAPFLFVTREVKLFLPDCLLKDWLIMMAPLSILYLLVLKTTPLTDYMFKVTRKFNAAFTNSLFWAESMKFLTLTTNSLGSILRLSSPLRLGLTECLFP
jgi:hypothetical protein